MDSQSPMTRLPPSPSSSLLSLRSDPDQEVNENPKRIIGVRELVGMARSGKVKTTVRDRQAIVIHGLPDGDEGLSEMAGPPMAPIDACFATDVAIRGWKVVGGSKGGEKAKLGAYVVYDIVIDLRSGGAINILRRYTDFVTLRQQLKASYPELRNVIPQLPGKAHMSKFSPKFLGERQPRLQRFLRTVMLHPQMGVGGRGDSVIYRWITSKDLG